VTFSYELDTNKIIYTIAVLFYNSQELTIIYLMEFSYHKLYSMQKGDRCARRSLNTTIYINDTKAADR
jgi:hypothetical protein